MTLPLGMGGFFARVDADIEGVVQAAVAYVTPLAEPVASASLVASPPAPTPSHEPPPLESLLAGVAPPPAPSPPASVAPSPCESPRASPVRRACAQRACTAQARQRIQDTLEWEACDESSNCFMAVEQQYDEAFSNEVLDNESESAGSDSAEHESESEDDDESYESSFVNDGSSSEYEDSDDEWTPLKRSRLSPEAQGAVREEDAPPCDDEQCSASEPADGAHSAPISPASAESYRRTLTRTPNVTAEQREHLASLEVLEKIRVRITSLLEDCERSGAIAIAELCRDVIRDPLSTFAPLRFVAADGREAAGAA
mmetsp:Transcript_75787/g.123052  ORF Transcript_75787/g.123052 Transcript_75787/m.123052 type:complete len:313 (-) Transcript_75787:612-1550(-)